MKRTGQSFENDGSSKTSRLYLVFGPVAEGPTILVHTSSNNEIDIHAPAHSTIPPPDRKDVPEIAVTVLDEDFDPCVPLSIGLRFLRSSLAIILSHTPVVLVGSSSCARDYFLSLYLIFHIPSCERGSNNPCLAVAH